jgi:hypothetical protein
MTFHNPNAHPFIPKKPLSLTAVAQAWKPHGSLVRSRPATSALANYEKKGGRIWGNGSIGHTSEDPHYRFSRGQRVPGLYVQGCQPARTCSTLKGVLVPRIVSLLGQCVVIPCSNLVECASFYNSTELGKALRAPKANGLKHGWTRPPRRTHLRTCGLS